MAKKTNGKKTTSTPVETPVVTTALVTTTPPPAWVDGFTRLHTVLSVVRGAIIPTPEVGRLTVTRAVDAAGALPTPTLNRCRFTGLSVAEFQNALFIANAHDAWRFNDAVLAVAWDIALPLNSARCAGGRGFTADIDRYIGGTRSSFNKGKHGSLPTGLVFVTSVGFGRGTKMPKPVTAPDPTPAADATPATA